MTNEIMPWQQQPGESDCQYKAFLVFLELGSNRNYRAVAENLNISYQTVKKYGRNHKWQFRALIYDGIMALNKNRLNLFPSTQNDNFKFDEKIKFSKILLDLLNNIYPSLNSLDNNSHYQDTIAKINLINKTVKTIDSIFKIIDSYNSDFIVDQKFNSYNNLINFMNIPDDDPYTDSDTGISEDFEDDDDFIELNFDDEN